LLESLTRQAQIFFVQGFKEAKQMAQQPGHTDTNNKKNNNRNIDNRSSDDNKSSMGSDLINDPSQVIGRDHSSTSAGSQTSQSQDFSDRTRGILNQGVDQGRDMLNQGMSQSRRIFDNVRSQVDTNPWYGIGVVAVLALGLGYWLGARGNSSYISDRSSAFNTGVDPSVSWRPSSALEDQV